jgi:putative endonuclease
MRNEKQPCVYILTNIWKKVLYTGVTSNLAERVAQHREKVGDGFTKKYNVSILVYFEFTETMDEAIAREKRIKAGTRQNKIDLIEKMNPGWKDLYLDVIP